MYPELFEIPFTHLTLKSYGLMMVVGFLFAVFLIRRLGRGIMANPNLITNAALYSLVGGVLGARLFYVVHYFDRFQGRLLSVFAIWQGGLEFLGGVILAIAVIIFYLRRHKLPIRRCFDILAIGLMLGLAFGRIGCFLNGCGFGKPTNLPWAVRFPYASFAYHSQVYPNPERNRPKPQLELSSEFFGEYSENGIRFQGLKPYEQLTQRQKDMVDKGLYRCLPVHPTQLYSFVNAVFLCLILYLFWRRAQNAGSSRSSNKLFAKPGCTFGLMLILYGFTRFFIEFLRDDSPLNKFDALTISQNISIATIVFGIILLAIFEKMEPNNEPRVTGHK